MTLLGRVLVPPDILEGNGVPSDIDMLKSVSHQITGLNLCPLGDSIEPFLASVVNRYEDHFRRYIKTAVAHA